MHVIRMDDLFLSDFDPRRGIACWTADPANALVFASWFGALHYVVRLDALGIGGAKIGYAF